MLRLVAATALVAGAVVAPWSASASVAADKGIRSWTMQTDAQVSQWRADMGKGRVLPNVRGFHATRGVAIQNDRSKPMTMSLTNKEAWTSVKKGQVYRVRIVVRTDTPDLSAGLMVREVVDGRYSTTLRNVKGVWLTDRQWHAVELKYRIRNTGSVLDINAMAWKAKPGSRLYVDHVRLTRITSSQLEDQRRQPAPPIEKVVAPTLETCGAQGPLAPRCGALWGAYTLQRGDATSAVVNLENRVGRQFDISLRYHDFSDTYPGRFPDAHEQTLGESRLLFLSWQARVSKTNTSLRWSDVAAGKYDAKFVDTAAERVKAYGKPMIIAFDPEFDSDANNRGTMREYVAAYRHVHDVFQRHGVNNVVWAWVSTGYTGAGNGQRILAGYPGDKYVDWVGYDPYNFYRCNGTSWKSFERTISGGYNWLMANGFGDKPIVLSEYGTQFDSAHPARSRSWVTSIPTTLKKYPNIKALIRFDSNGVFGSRDCNLYIGNGTGMVDAFAEAGRHPYVNQR